MFFRDDREWRQRAFVLLAPPGNEPIEDFRGRLTVSRELHSHLLTETQRFRGQVYLAEKAIRPEDLDAWGRHVQPIDSRSWHLVMLGARGRVVGCTRFRRHTGPVTWGQLGIRQAPIAHSNEWGLRFRASVNAELAAAWRAGFSYV